MNPELLFALSLLGSPFAQQATNNLDGALFADESARSIFDAVQACLKDGASPTAELVRRRLETFGLEKGIDLTKQVMLTQAEMQERAGQIAQRGIQANIGRQLIQIGQFISANAGKLINDEISQRVRAIIANETSRNAAEMVYLNQWVDDAVQTAIGITQGTIEQRRWAIGEPYVDTRWQMGPGEENTFAAPSSHGKTTFLWWVMRKLLRRHSNFGAAYIPLADVSPVYLAGRALAGRARLDSKDVIFDGLDDAQAEQDLHEGAKRLKADIGRRCVLPRRCGRYVDQVLAAIRRAYVQLKADGLRPSLFVIDYAQKTKLQGRHDEHEPTARLAAEAKDLAEELDICITIASQFNYRAMQELRSQGANYRPSPSDVFAGGKLWNEATSMAALVRRDEIEIRPRPELDSYGKRTGHEEQPPKWLSGHDVELWAIKARNGAPDTPARLHALGALATYQHRSSSLLQKWNEGAQI